VVCAAEEAVEAKSDFGLVIASQTVLLGEALARGRGESKNAALAVRGIHRDEGEVAPNVDCEPTRNVGFSL
jgi:hypothetical protein